MRQRGILAWLCVITVVVCVFVTLHVQTTIDEVRDDQYRQAGAIATLIGRTCVDYDYLQSVSVRVVSPAGSGSGVLYSRDGRTFCWTAGHVVAKYDGGVHDDVVVEQEIRVNGIYQDTRKIKAKVVAYSEADERQDLAILELEEYVDVTTVFAANQVYMPGTPVVHVGSMSGLYNSVTIGIVSQTDRDLLENGIMFDQTCVIAYPGSSGGGTYLMNGQCMGIHVRGGKVGMGFIVPVRRMWDWAEKFDLMWAMDPSVPMPKEIAVVMDEPVHRETE